MARLPFNEETAQRQSKIRHKLDMSQTWAGFISRFSPDRLESPGFNELDLSIGPATLKAFQDHPDWIWPYWMEQQSDPAGEAFVADSQAGMMVNTTRRNWTIVGPPNLPYRALVDPRGLISPWHGSWSVDVWLTAGGKTYYPSRLEHVEQRLGGPVPEVFTMWAAGGFQVRTTVTALGIRGFPWLMARVQVRGTWGAAARMPVAATGLGTEQGMEQRSAGMVADHPMAAVGEASTNEDPAMAEQHGANVQLHVAVRPCHPEGVARIESIDFSDYAFSVNGMLGTAFSKRPDRVDCGCAAGGDTAQWLDRPAEAQSDCPQGLGNGLATFDLDTQNGSPDPIDVFIPMKPERSGGATPVMVSEEIYRPELLSSWEAQGGEALHMEIPDGQLQEMVDANMTALRLFAGELAGRRYRQMDRETQLLAMWLVFALDHWGLHARAADILSGTVPGRPGRRKMQTTGLLSADGRDNRWLWTAAQHFFLTADRSWLAQEFPAILASARQLTKNENNRRVSQRLNHSDLFWTTAALRDIAVLAHHAAQPEVAREWRDAYSRLIREVHERLYEWGSLHPDWLEAVYPLEMAETDSREAFRLLQALVVDGLAQPGYFNRRKSGYDVAVSLLLARCRLSQGRNGDVWNTIGWLRKRALATHAIPAVIHPRTGGGCRGAGHSPLTTALFLLLVRDMLVGEINDSVVIGKGIPAEWYRPGARIGVSGAATRFGSVSFEVLAGDGQVELNLNDAFRVLPQNVIWEVPFEIQSAEADGAEALHRSSSIVLLPQTRRVVLGRNVP